MAQLMPLPLTVSCFSKIQIGFTFLVPSHLGSPRKGLLNGCVCVCVCVCVFARFTLFRLKTVNSLRHTYLKQEVVSAANPYITATGQNCLEMFCL